jgi:oligopeptide transport system permease protein
MGIVCRLVRTTLLQEITSDYIRSARAKGLGEGAILIRHALPNTAIPILSVMGPIAANILTGSFVVEHFFSIPGMAKHFIQAVISRDIFLMMGVTITFAALLLVSHLITEFLIKLADPRIRA